MAKIIDIQNIIYNLPEIKELRMWSGCEGITYGRSRNQTNPLRGSHAIIITEESIVIVARSKAKNSPIYYFGYVRTRINSIGENLRPYLKNYSPITDINIIRNIPEIDTAYQMASGKGRPYGVDPAKPLYGSHIALIEPEELLIIRQHRRHKKIKLFHYRRGASSLGKKVISILNHHSFTFLSL